MFLITNFDETISKLNEMLGTNDFELFSSLFQVKVVTMIQCECGRTIPRKDEYACIPLRLALERSEVPFCERVLDFVNGSPAQWGKYFCHKQGIVMGQFSKLPKVLVFQFERFNPTLYGFTKDVRHVPLVLHLDVPGEDGIGSYDLRAVLIHVGPSIEAGHYITVYRNNPYWFLADDESVRLLNLEAVERFISSGSVGTWLPTPAAYLLFYEEV
jgi:uncharacterized UBP type Zn finger protein